MWLVLFWLRLSLVERLVCPQEAVGSNPTNHYPCSSCFLKRLNIAALSDQDGLIKNLLTLLGLDVPPPSCCPYLRWPSAKSTGVS